MSQGYDELIGDTLALVNAARSAYGKDMLNELPDARRGATGDCLFYRALDGIGITSVGSDAMSFDNERTANYVAQLWGTEKIGAKQIRAPKQFREVISAFDGNKINFYAVGPDN